MLALFVDSLEQRSAVIITLSSRKVYAGYIWELPNLEIKMNSILILPTMSGYRDSATLDVKFTTNYVTAWKNNVSEARNFSLVVPIASITSAALFDETLYNTHFESLGQN